MNGKHIEAAKAVTLMPRSDDKRLTPAECRREAVLYAEQANAEPQVGTSTALLNIARSWQTIADQIERLELVREINAIPSWRHCPLQLRIADSPELC